MKNFSLASFLIFFSSMVSVSLLFDAFITGKFIYLLKPPSEKFEIKKPFPRSPRFPSSPSIGATVQSIHDQYRHLLLLKAKRAALPYDIEFHLLPANFTSSSASYGNAVQVGINSSVIVLRPRDPDLADKKPILIATHVDSTRYAGAADYDSLVHVEAMFYAIEKIVKRNVSVERSIYFAFVGSEDFGQLGARFWTSFVLRDAYYIMLSGFGTERPFTLVTKSKKASSVIRALSKVNGLSINTAFNEFRDRHDSQKSSKIFDQSAGYNGAGLSFVGNPSKHKTPFDEIDNSMESHFLGRTIYRFVRNFKEDKVEYDLAAFGIAPFVLKISASFLKYLAFTFVIVGLGTVFFQIKKSDHDYLPFMKVFCTSSGYVFLMYSLFAYLIILLNTGSFIGHYNTYTLMIMVSLLCLYFDQFGRKENFGKKEDWQLVQFFYFLLVVFLFRNSQIVIPFLVPFILSMIVFMKPDLPPSVSMTFYFVTFLPIALQFSLSYRTFSICCISLPDFVADILPLIFIYVYSLSIFVSTMAISFSVPYIALIYEEPVKEVMKYLPYVIYALFLIKPRPFNKNVLIRSSLAQYYYHDSNRTTISLSPVPGKRVIRLIHKHMRKRGGIKYQPRFKGENLNEKFPSFVQEIDEVSLPPFFTEWPKVTTSRFTNGGNESLRQFYLNIHQIPPKVHMIEIRITCPDEPCVAEMIMLNPHHVLVNNKYVMVFRHNTFFSPFSWRFSLNTTQPVNATIIYQSNDESEEMKQFRDSFPRFVQPYQDERILQESLFVYNQEL